MSRRTLARRLMATAAIAVMSLGTLHAASASTRAPADPATPGNPVTASASELYTGVAPCRLVDTRLAGGPVISVRHLDASGDLTAQGGAANCGVPTNATSLAVNITAIPAAPGTGYLRGWAYMHGPVDATLVNYSDEVVNMSNLVNLQLCGVVCGHAFDLRGYGAATNVVVDVLGYYRRAIFAQINATGTAGDSSGLKIPERPSTGFYRLQFDRAVDSCSAVVTDTDPNTSHTFAVQPGSQPGQSTYLFVRVRDMSGALANAPFAIRVTC